MSDNTMKASEEWDNEYQETVLKVPDGLAVSEGDTTKEMVVTGKAPYKVFAFFLKCTGNSIISVVYTYYLTWTICRCYRSSITWIACTNVTGYLKIT